MPLNEEQQKQLEELERLRDELDSEDVDTVVVRDPQGMQTQLTGKQASRWLDKLFGSDAAGKPEQEGEEGTEEEGEESIEDDTPPRGKKIKWF